MTRSLKKEEEKLCKKKKNVGLFWQEVVVVKFSHKLNDFCMKKVKTRY